MLPIGWVQGHCLDLDDQIVVTELGGPNVCHDGIALLLVDDGTDGSHSSGGSTKHVTKCEYGKDWNWGAEDKKR